MKGNSFRSSAFYRLVRLILLYSFMIAFISSYANATPIKYNITGGHNTLGDPLTGYVFIEDMPSFTNYNEDEEGNFQDCVIDYNIVCFAFNSSTGNLISEVNGGGLLEILFTVFEGEMYSMSNGFFYDSKGNHWGNDNNGVSFTGRDQDYLQYLTLPQQIIIYGMCTITDVSCPIGNLILNRQAKPIPEPSTMFLLGTGLIGLAGIRNKLRK